MVLEPPLDVGTTNLLIPALYNMGYTPCKADPDVWMKDCQTHYEYVCVYVDGIMFYGKEPQKFFDALTTQYNYKLKGDGKPVYHLGGDFFCDKDNTLALGTSTYVNKMLTNYELMFNEKSKEASSPMVEKDHPELDLTEELDEDGIKQYQSLIPHWSLTMAHYTRSF
jgi:hypothetical protein